MNQLISILFFLSLSFSLMSQVTFQREYYPESHGHGNSVLQTNDGGYVVCGSIYPNSAGRLLLFRTDSPGDTIWSHAYFGDASYQYDHSIVATGDGGFITCARLSDSIYLLKISANGDSLWGRMVAKGQGHAIEPTNDGGYVICDDQAGLHLVKTDSNGFLQWEKVLSTNTTAFYQVFSIKQTPDSGFVVSGSFYGLDNNGMVYRTDKYGDSLWMKQHVCPGMAIGFSISLAGDDGYFVCGTSIFNDQAMVLRLNGSGDTLWSRTINASVLLSGQALPDGSYITTGSAQDSSGGENVVIYKFAGDGETLWHRIFSFEQESRGWCIRNTTDGGFVVTGLSYQENTNISAAILIKTNANGLLTGLPGLSGAPAFSVYPNPAHEVVTVTFAPTSQVTNLELYNTDGKMVLYSKVTPGFGEVRLRLQELPAGIYFLELIDEKGVLGVQKVVKI